MGFAVKPKEPTAFGDWEQLPPSPPPPKLEGPRLLGTEGKGGCTTRGPQFRALLGL